MKTTPCSWFVPLGVLLVVCTAPTSSRAQSFDLGLFEALEAECNYSIERAVAAAGISETGIALVQLDMGAAACDRSRDMVSLAGAIVAPDRLAEFVDAVLTRDLRLVDLWISVDQCLAARDVLDQTARLSADLTDPQSIRFGAAAFEVLRCLPVGAGAEVLSLETSATETWRSGVTQGVVSAGSFGDCAGLLPVRPNYILSLASQSEISVDATSEGDLVMVMSGPGGTFCNDDTVGMNPQIWGTFAAGDYDLWIGEYSPTPTGTPFTMTAYLLSSATPTVEIVPPSELPTTTPSDPPIAPSEVLPETPSGEMDWTLSTAFYAGSRQGFVPNSAGLVDSADQGEGCGFTVVDAQHHLSMPDAQSVLLEVRADDGRELNVMLRHDSGRVICARVTPDRPVALHESLEAGHWALTIGSAPLSVGVVYTATLMAGHDPSAPPNAAWPGPPSSEAPYQLRRPLSASTPGIHVNGVTVFPAEEPTAAVDCVGMFPSQAAFLLHVDYPGMYSLWVEGSQPLSIWVEGVGREWCGSDGGTSPHLELGLSAGVYRIHVGPIGTIENVAFELNLAAW